MPEPTKPASGQIIVAMTEDGRNVVINHPDLEPDAEGCGHIVFSPEQAVKLALLLWSKANVIRGISCGHCGDAITQEGGWATAMFRYCFKQECQQEFYKEAQAMIRKVNPEVADRLAAATGKGFWCSGTAANVRGICTIQCSGCHDEQKRKNLVNNHAEEQTFTCPKCGRVSYNPGDILNRYCGACHEFAK